MDKLKASRRDHGQQLVTSGGPEKKYGIGNNDFYVSLLGPNGRF